MPYKSLDALEKDLKRDIDNVLKKEVCDAVISTELRQIHEVVFGSYNPSVYVRRTFGGIDDPSNIIADCHDNQLVVRNVAEFNQAYPTMNQGVGLADLIETGGGSGHNYDYASMYERGYDKPRPFQKETVKELVESGELGDAVTKGLQRKGYNVN